MKTIKRLNQAGDTIIEVMVVLAVLGMSFGISYATASKGLNQSLNAQEHSEALGIIDTQLQELRIALTTQPTGFPPTVGHYFCMTSDSTFYDITANDPNTFPNSAADDSSGNYAEYGPASTDCNFSTLFHVSINEALATPSSSTSYYYQTPIPTNCTTGLLVSCNEDSFTIMVRWDGAGGLDPQQESMTYRAGTQLGGTYLDQQPISVPLPPPIVVYGSNYTSCIGYTGGQGGLPDSCHQTSGDGVYSYSDFDALYAGINIPAGQYTITVTYENENGGSWPPPSSGNFQYQIAAWLFGSTFNQTINLPTESGVSTYTVGTFNLPALPGAILIMNWDNNQWVDSNGNGEGVTNNNPSPGSYDPNLQIDKITFTPN